MQYIAPTTCVLPYFCRSSVAGSKVKSEIPPIDARSRPDRGPLQLYVFYHTSVASSRGQCNTSLQLRVFYRTSVALVGVDLRSNQKSARSGENRGSLQLYVFYHTSVASSRGQCNTSLQLRVFYRTSVALVWLDLRSNPKSPRSIAIGCSRLQNDCPALHPSNYVCFTVFLSL